MDLLFGLLCLPFQHTFDVTELKRANFNTLLEKSIVHSSEIMKNSTLKREVSEYMTTSLNNKSHTINNTRRTIQNMMEMAIQTRKTNKEKDLLRWLQFCIDTCLSQQQQQQVVYIKKDLTKKESITNNKGKVNSLIHHSIPQKTNLSTTTKNSSDHNKNTNKNKKKKDMSINYQVIGDSDSDDFVLSKKEKGDSHSFLPNDHDNHDNRKHAPITKKVQRKRKSKVIYTPLFKDGVGTNVVTHYFLKNHQEANISKKGYFAKSYFFPSEESFNAFSSVLRSAQKTIDICIFSMTDNDVANILIAAKQRKVNVRIITDNKQVKIKGANTERLHSDHKIPYKTNHSSSYMHHKFAMPEPKIKTI
ncbi:unnamed protein product [Cunninghamella blakesleeana]